MSKYYHFVIYCLFFSVFLSLSLSSNGQSINELTTQINDILSQCQSNHSCFGTSWSISVDQFNSSTWSFDKTYSYNELSALTPASNTKLFTTSVMYLLAKHYKLETGFYTDNKFQAGLPIETLCVQGQGDPSLTSDQLEQAAQLFAKASSINNLVLDTSFYTGNTIPPSWEWEDLTSTYGALPTTLIVNENTITFTVEAGSSVGGTPSIIFTNQSDSAYLNPTNSAVTGTSTSQNTISISFSFGSLQPIVTGSIPLGTSATFSVPILDPDNYFLSTFAEMIALNSEDARPASLSFGFCGDNMYPGYFTESDTVSALINHTLLVSDNIYAESFLRIMGALKNNSDAPSSQNGLFFIQKVLASMGVEPLLYQQVDGSGLSRDNLITSKAITQLLKVMYRAVGDSNHEFFTLLPIGGETGTLANRPLSSAVHAKTGSMTGVSSLSGIIAPQNIEKTANPVIFSIIANNANYAIQLDPIIDAITNILTQYASSTNL